MKKSKSKYRSAVKTGDVRNVENVENAGKNAIAAVSKSDKIVGKTGNLKNESGENHRVQNIHIL